MSNRPDQLQIQALKAAGGYRTVLPQPGFHMVGYTGAARLNPASGVHDAPLVVGLLLEAAGLKTSCGQVFRHRFLFLSVDVCVLTKDKTDIMKQAICRQTGIPPEHIVISATHTHSGPGGLDSSYLAAPENNRQYLRQTAEAMAGLAGSLIRELKFVTAQIKQVPIEGFYGNRNCPERPVDTTATLIRFLDRGSSPQAAPVAALLNINCHSTVVGQEVMLSTSDLLGAVRHKLSAKLGCLPYTFAGAAADISNRNFRQGNDFAELERTADGICAQLWSGGGWQELDVRGPLKTADFSYAICYDNTEFFPQYEALCQTIEGQLEAADLTADQRRLKEAELTNVRRKLAQKQIDIPVVIKLVQLGQLRLLTFPGELASALGAQITAVKPENPGLCTLLIGYADDYQGYFMEANMYGKCYETVASDVPQGEPERLIEQLGEIL